MYVYSYDFIPFHRIRKIKVLIRRMVILVVYVTEYTHVLRRTYGIAILCFLICIGHFWAWPFRLQEDNVLESISLAVLTYAAMTKIGYPGEK